MSDLIYLGADKFAQYEVDSVRALNDLKPGSAFLNQLNAYPENFQKAAVIGKTPQRWLVSRVSDAISGTNPDAAFGERNAANTTELVYDVVLAEFVIATLEEAQLTYYCDFGDGSDGSDPICYSDPYYDEIAHAISILNTMDTVDAFFDDLIAPAGDGSDGFVQNTSQFYPSTSAVQLVVKGADSHQSATRSPYDRTALNLLLKSVYQVTTPASCTFSSGTPLVSTGVGTSYALVLNTSSYCAWSAVSQTPWITIPANSENGKGSSVITFNTQSLISNTSRSGTIQIGNGTNSITITVYQASSTNACTYTLSTTNVGWSPLGGSTVVQVGTQTGCTWSAASTQDWLTTQNGSGTGPGTFTLIAAPSANGYTRQASLDVMSQIITVTEGYHGGPVFPINPQQ